MKRVRAKKKATAPASPIALAMTVSKENEQHLKDAYRDIRSAYSFLSARNIEYARQKLSAGLTHLDRALAPWV